jgi:hypothetical protein
MECAGVMAEVLITSAIESAQKAEKNWTGR